MRYLLRFLFLLTLVACQAPETLPKPDILVSNSSLEINAVKRVFELTVRNTGEEGSVLEWRAKGGSLALVMDPPNGALTRGESQSVRVSVNRANVPIADRLEAKVVFESNGGDKGIFITFSIEGTGLAACGTYPTQVRPPTEPGPGEDEPTLNPGGDYVSNELLVGYKIGYAQQYQYRNNADIPTASVATTHNVAAIQATDAARRAQTLAAVVASDYGLTVKNQPSAVRPALVKIPAGQDPLTFAETLASDPRIDFAEPNYYLEAQGVPNDEFYEEQWNMRDFGMEQAWAIQTGDDPRENEDIIIAIMDTGFDADHPDLKEKMLPGCDFFDKDNDPDPRAIFGRDSLHGTHVAGIAVAIGNNNEGVAGVAYGANVKFLPIKVFDDPGINGTLDLVIDALLWLAGEDIEGAEPNPFPPKIINMSIGGNPAKVGGSLASLTRATKTVREAGILMIGATGNEYRQNGDENGVHIPAADENILAVGSVDRNYQRSDFSQFNDNPERLGVDLMAPGGYANVGSCGAVLSTVKFEGDASQGYACDAGTSMASPFVAGVAALLWSQNPNLSAEQVRARLLSTTYYDDSFMTEAAYGSGVVCADRALGAATQCGR